MTNEQNIRHGYISVSLIGNFPLGFCNALEHSKSEFSLHTFATRLCMYKRAKNGLCVTETKEALRKMLTPDSVS